MQTDIDLYPARSRYQDPAVAAGYEAVRFGGIRGRGSNWAERRALRRALALLPGTGCVLDLPCGSGRMQDLLQPRIVVGADISYPMLLAARRRFPFRGLVRCEAERLPFPDGVFDAVVCVRLMQHLDAPQRAEMLLEMARVSTWVLVTYASPDLLVRMRIALRLPPRADPHPWFAVSRSRLRAELRAAGLRPQRILPVAPGISPLVVAVARRP